MSRELDEQYGFPVACLYFHEPIPDLARIPRGRWPETMGPLSERGMRRALSELSRTASSMEEHREASAAATEAWLAAPSLAPGPHRRRPPRRLEPPQARRPPQRAHQVNVRLYGRDHDALVEAAKLAGAKPTELARWMIVSGTRRMLYENRRAQTAARPTSA